MSAADINRFRDFMGGHSGTNGSNGVLPHGEPGNPAGAPAMPDSHPIDLGVVDGKQAVFLPDGDTQIIDTAKKVFSLEAPHHQMFTRGGAVVEVRLTKDGVPVLDLLKPAAVLTRFEKRCRFMAIRAGKNGERVIVPRNMPKDIAESILLSKEAREILPAINGLINCPILREENGTVRVIGKGYDAASGLLITGGQMPPTVDWPEAVQALDELHSDFRFQTPGDESRAMAMLLTPALKIGGLISGNVPIDIAEATESQSGKNYRLKVKAAVYGEPLALVSKREGGVGSMDETFSDHLMRGRPFPTFDNLRGPLDSQFLESFLTAEGSFSVRIPYHGNIEIDPSRFFVALTSNGVETTRDLANRACIVRIQKQRAGYPYRVYPEGDVLSHVKANRAYYLGCVFAVIKTWIACGRPVEKQVDHDFREWAQILGWIVRLLFRHAPLLEGHRAAQARVGNNALNFLRTVALAHRSRVAFGAPLSASNIVGLCEEEGITIPGVQPGHDQDAAGKQVGVLMKAAFDGSDRIELDGFVIERHTVNVPREDGKGTRPQRSYQFRMAAAVPAQRAPDKPPQAPSR
jgi:hypothetical protein